MILQDAVSTAEAAYWHKMTHDDLRRLSKYLEERS